MSDPAAQRDFALEIVRRLRAAGHEALWAGGCVRDQLLGLVAKDYDVATSATPDQVRDLFGRRRTLPIGAAFGVVAVLGPRRAGQIEVATFRSDAGYSDGRHPDSVVYTNAREDAARRDFTINALFFDPVADEVVDYVAGQQDLARGVVRAVGDPQLRLAEDKLRMLRAVRFAATFDFAIDTDTLAAIREMASQVGSVSAERIGMELRRMLTGNRRAAALRLLADSALLPQVLPEVAALPPADFDAASAALERLSAPSLPLALAALLYRAAGQELVREVGRRLRYTNKEVDRAAWLLASLPIIRDAPSLPWPRVQRVLANSGAAEVVALLEATAGADDPSLPFCRDRLALPPEVLDPPPLVDGSDLIAHGLAPGPRFSLLLERVRDAQLTGQIDSRAAALEFVDRLRAAGLDAET